MSETEKKQKKAAPSTKAKAAKRSKNKAKGKLIKIPGFGSLRRRDIIVLGGFWGSIVCVMLIMLTFFILRQSEISKPVYTIETNQTSALNLYPLAQQAAVEWLGDVQFISTSAVWDGSTLVEVQQPIDWFKQLEQPTEWVYRFYSPSVQRILFVIVTPDQTVIIRPHISKVRRETRVIEPEQWQVDSPKAISFWLNNQGAAWLGQVTTPIISLQLTMDAENQTPIWTITGLNPDNGQSVFYTVKANRP